MLPADALQVTVIGTLFPVSVRPWAMSWMRCEGRSLALSGDKFTTATCVPDSGGVIGVGFSHAANAAAEPRNTVACRIRARRCDSLNVNGICHSPRAQRFGQTRRPPASTNVDSLAARRT